MHVIPQIARDRAAISHLNFLYFCMKCYSWWLPIFLVTVRVRNIFKKLLCYMIEYSKINCGSQPTGDGPSWFTRCTAGNLWERCTLTWSIWAWITPSSRSSGVSADPSKQVSKQSLEGTTESKTTQLPSWLHSCQPSRYDPEPPDMGTSMLPWQGLATFVTRPCHT